MTAIGFTGQNHIAHVNPLRYRGYCYDSDTGYYYLQSRYYDPEIGRFISADAIVGANENMLAYNLFAYCSNDSVNLYDPTGKMGIERGINRVIKEFWLTHVWLNSRITDRIARAGKAGDLVNILLGAVPSISVKVIASMLLLARWKVNSVNRGKGIYFNFNNFLTPASGAGYVYCISTFRSQ
ncbi:RHS repeat-associated core domain-containing protein [Candidatus Soleaferrea massiliensis]|uniref:RHS repeat-associated core domain-containing protein n=1 Tax=Candidatus Soleaferrea massiliensis TaxID=1470354 RepID=UPI001FA73674|nr:RHS repeat-associated core domain-containing protein [Candidatus Soleaferrea massiliensis]